MQVETVFIIVRFYLIYFEMHYVWHFTVECFQHLYKILRKLLKTK